MDVLLVRPNPGNERFGLGPFFRVEPLGLEYLAAALETAGHRAAIADLRFRPTLRSMLSRNRPRVVGISCLHALEYDEVLKTARSIRRLAPDVFVVVGGHAAAAYPAPLLDSAIDAICTIDGEAAIVELVDALEGDRALSTVGGLLLRARGENTFERTSAPTERVCLNRVPRPARHLVDRYRSRYHCINYKPLWLVETARGCPYRCNFCSVWRSYDRSVRTRGIDPVVEDFAAVGPHVFVADDLFWNQPARSLELAEALAARGVHKRWILVQTRTDTVAKHPELLARWRPLAERFDIFFGLEAASDRHLDNVDKDSGLASTLSAIKTARALDFGVTGNFLIDLEWEREDFEELWDFIAEHALERSGFTIKTPLPGTAYFEQVRAQVEGQPWFKYDMHHALWEPRLGAQTFFELYAETWRRSVLNLKGRKNTRDWLRQVELTQIPFLLRVLRRTQQLMKPEAYLKHHSSLAPAPTGPTSRLHHLPPAE
jgi:hopanoid C-3 methylase